jgi:hypothetical protein
MSSGASSKKRKVSGRGGRGQGRNHGEVLSELEESEQEEITIERKRKTTKTKEAQNKHLHALQNQLDRIEKQVARSSRHNAAERGADHRLPARPEDREEANKRRLQEIASDRLEKALEGKQGWNPRDNALLRKRRKNEVEDYNDEQVANYITTITAVGRADSYQNYLSSFRAWRTFCDQKSFDWRQPHEIAMLHFTVWRFSGGLSVASLSKEFGKIKVILADSGVEMKPIREMPAVRGLLKGMKTLEDHHDPKERKYPLTTCHLQDMLTQLETYPAPGEVKEVTSAMWKVMYFGLLRIGEALRKRKGSGEGFTQPLLWKHVKFYTCPKSGLEYVVLSLPPSKTDRTGKKFKIVLPRLEERHARICPVRAIIRLRDQLPVGVDCSHWELFEHQTQGVKLTYEKYTKILKECLRAAGYDDSKYSSHCWRIGGATVARALGFSKDDIKMLGRWESDCWKVYTRPVLEHQGALTARLQDWQHKLTFS